MSLRLPTATLDLSGTFPRWIYSDGTILPYFGGGAPEDDEDQGGEDDDPSGDEDEDDEDDKGDGDEDDDDPEVKSLKAKIAALESEKSRHYKRRKAAEKKIAELEAQISDSSKGKGKDDDGSSEDLRQDNQALASIVRDMRVENAFLRNNQYNWHNVKTALRLLNAEDVDINDDGSVDGMDEAVEALAKEHPYLLKKGKDDDDDDETPSKGAPVGRTPKPKNKGQGPSREDLMRKYAGLRR